jgi:hypothetical protein
VNLKFNGCVECEFTSSSILADVGTRYETIFPWSLMSYPKRKGLIPGYDDDDDEIAHHIAKHRRLILDLMT